jgi:hypothetical protein
MEEENVQSWNKKRIFIAVFLLALLLAGGYFYKTRVLGETLFRPSKSVQGINTEKENAELPGINVQETVKEKINSLKQQVAGLNISDIASSSPQVQKILNDIESLEQYPTDQVKEICRKICGL